MPELAEPSADSILRRLEWTVLRRLDGMLHGDYRTLFRGFGLDLADLREYQYNDDVRHIDWNVTARLQTPYVREYYEDREVSAWFMLDLSPSLDFGSGMGGLIPRLRAPSRRRRLPAPISKSVRPGWRRRSAGSPAISTIACRSKARRSI